MSWTPLRPVDWKSRLKLLFVEGDSMKKGDSMIGGNASGILYLDSEGLLDTSTTVKMLKDGSNNYIIIGDSPIKFNNGLIIGDEGSSNLYINSPICEINSKLTISNLRNFTFSSDSNRIIGGETIGSRISAFLLDEGGYIEFPIVESGEIVDRVRIYDGSSADSGVVIDVGDQEGRSFPYSLKIKSNSRTYRGLCFETTGGNAQLTYLSSYNVIDKNPYIAGGWNFTVSQGADGYSYGSLYVNVYNNTPESIHHNNVCLVNLNSGQVGRPVLDLAVRHDLYEATESGDYCLVRFMETYAVGANQVNYVGLGSLGFQKTENGSAFVVFDNNGNVLNYDSYTKLWTLNGSLRLKDSDNNKLDISIDANRSSVLLSSFGTSKTLGGVIYISTDAGSAFSDSGDFTTYTSLVPTSYKGSLTIDGKHFESVGKTLRIRCFGEIGISDTDGNVGITKITLSEVDIGTAQISYQQDTIVPWELECFITTSSVYKVRCIGVIKFGYGGNQASIGDYSEVEINPTSQQLDLRMRFLSDNNVGSYIQVKHMVVEVLG